MTTQFPKAIHQFHSGSAVGDGVTNGMFFTRRLLRALGYVSEIYVEHIADELSDELKDYHAFCDRTDELLLVHHSFGHDVEQWLLGLNCPKVLVYHNITPAEFFAQGSDFYHYAQLGRQQLARWVEQDLFDAALSDSDLNQSELLQLGFNREHTVLPLLIDLELWREGLSAMASDSTRLAEAPYGSSESFNLLFVGRIARNKNQHLLLQLVAELRHHFPWINWQLTLVGGCSDVGYLEELQQDIKHRDLCCAVSIPGKVSQPALVEAYKKADLFVCLSAHEGFGMPLIEAMFFDLPVVAGNSSNIAATLDQAGLLVECADDQERVQALLKLIAVLQQRPDLLKRMVLSGQQRVQKLEPDYLQMQLKAWLDKVIDQIEFAQPEG